MVGAGRGDAISLVAPGYNTTLIADSGFPVSTPLVSLCSTPGPCFGVQVEHMALDCNGVTGCIGAYNAYAQEQSWFSNISVLRAPGTGVWVDGNPGGTPTYASQNSGPYENIEVLPLDTGIANTICFRAILVPAWRGLRGITCNADGYSVRPTNGIYLDGSSPAQVTDIHVEHFVNAVVLGTATYGQINTIVSNAHTGPDVDTSVLITTPVAQGHLNITLIAIENSTVASNVLIDNSNSITIAASGGGLGFYSIGNGTGGTQTVITSRNDVTTKFETPLTVRKNLSIPGTGTNANDSRILLGPSPNSDIIYTDPAVSGAEGLVIRTAGATNGDKGMLIQTKSVTEGAVGGGLYLNGNGYASDADWGAVGAGYTGDMGTMKARSATPAGIFFQDGVITVKSATGQTIGNDLTFTDKLIVNTNGSFQAPTPVHFADLGTPANGTWAYCDDCANYCRDVWRPST